jgi:site-specific DNA recombinase
MRIRPYIRRSHKRAGGISLEVQRQSITINTEQQGSTLDAVEYVDDGRSAFRDDIKNRPAMQQALLDAKRREFDVLIVYRWDRLARSEAMFHGLLADFKKLKVEVISATESNEPLARSIHGLLGADSSRSLSGRIKDVRRTEASMGMLVGLPPRGYDRGSDRIPIPNSDASMVRQLGELYATGEYSAARLAVQFGLHTDAVHEMLQCPVYAGFIACNDHIYQGKHMATRTLGTYSGDTRAT